MVQEVISVEAELQLLDALFTDLEVLVHAEIAVEEGWAEDLRQYDRAIVSRRRQGETTAVYKLVRAQVRHRIAGENRPERDRISAVDAPRRDPVPTRQRRAV